MRFASPWTLWLLALVPAMGLLLWGSLVHRGRRLARLVSAALLPRLLVGASAGRLASLGALRIAGLGLFIVALARPQWGRRDEPVVRRGVDVVLALDLSASMLGEDVSPNRLEQARSEAVSLVESLSGDRVALVTFGGRAAVQCPLTLDYGAVRLFLDAADASFAPGPGSDLGRGILEAARLLGSAGSSDPRHKTIVLLTDGEDLEGGALEAVRTARQAGIVVHCIGVGSPRGGPIPLRDDGGTLTGYKKDRDGKVVTTRFDPAVLDKIALATDGVFLHAGPAGDAGDRIAQAISRMEKRELSSRLATRFEDRFQVPLAAGLILLGLEAVWMPRRRTHAARAPSGADRRGGRARPVGAGATALAILLCVALPPRAALAREGPSGSEAEDRAAEGSAPRRPDTAQARGARASREGGRGADTIRDPGAQPLRVGAAPSAGVARKNREGNRLYLERRYPDALSRYEEAGSEAPDLPAIRYNIGNALFRQGKYAEAASEYSRALHGADRDLEPAARYNLGNAQFQQGSYKDAIDSYRKVLQKRPEDDAARQNLELALRALEAPHKQPSPNEGEPKPQEDREKSGGDRKGSQDQRQPKQDQQEGDASGADQDPNRDAQGDEDGSGRDGAPEGAPEHGEGKGRDAQAGAKGTLPRKEAERLLDSFAQEEKRDLRRRLARMPREQGPEKDW